jgi:chorismate mutase / prephenate dehydratase
LTASDQPLPSQLRQIDEAILDLVEKRSELLAKHQSELGTLASHASASLVGVAQNANATRKSLADRMIPLVAGITFQESCEPVRIAYLGPEFSYSYSAARKFFGPAGLQAVQSIAAVFEEIERHQAQYGIVPIENSTDGRIVDTLTMFVRKSVRICGEVYLPIHHNLLAMGERSEIKEVHSKPQALSQCRAWLADHLPGVKWVEVTSTAVAARNAVNQHHIAAVASKDAGIAMGLNVIAENIEDRSDNVTRFAIIGQEDANPTDRDKTSIMFQVPHKPGALADAMLIFRDRGLNLTWIESFPIPGSPNEYFFFVELDGHRMTAAVREAIEALETMALRLNVLGSYPKGIP